MSGLNTGIYAVVQARRCSSRFPDKVLADICGKPILQRVLERVQVCELVEKIVLATTVQPEDKELVNLAQGLGYSTFTGSVDDVLSRYYHCTEGANTIIRITADCPLTDSTLINGVVQYHLIGEFEFTTNRPSYPDGMDVEVMSRTALEKVWRRATSAYDREHVTSYIYSHPREFNIGSFSHDIDFSDKHWSVDTPGDLEFVRNVYEKLGEYFTLADLLSAISVRAL